MKKEKEEEQEEHSMFCVVLVDVFIVHCSYKIVTE